MRTWSLPIPADLILRVIEVWATAARRANINICEWLDRSEIAEDNEENFIKSEAFFTQMEKENNSPLLIVK